MYTMDDMMPSERSQSQKTTYYMIPFTGTVQNGPIQGDGKEISGC